MTVLGERVQLAATEFELLCKLGSSPYNVFSKEELLCEIWNFRSLGHTRTVDSHARACAASSPARAAGPFVINEWGVGYRLLDG